MMQLKLIALENYIYTNIKILKNEIYHINCISMPHYGYIICSNLKLI
jgi:hypothetical protein